MYVPQASSVGLSLAVGAERKRGADQQDALQLAAQLGARSQGGGGVGGGASSIDSSEGVTDRDKKLKNLRKVRSYCVYPSVCLCVCVCVRSMLAS